LAVRTPLTVLVPIVRLPKFVIDLVDASKFDVNGEIDLFLIASATSKKFKSTSSCVRGLDFTVIVASTLDLKLVTAVVEALNFILPIAMLIFNP
jgi:hypothetical protein